MANYGVYFGENDEGARRDDFTDVIMGEEDGWSCHQTGTLEEIMEWLVDEWNNEDLPGMNNHWMRVMLMPSSEILDGDEVVL